MMRRTSAKGYPDSAELGAGSSPLASRSGTEVGSRAEGHGSSRPVGPRVGAYLKVALGIGLMVTGICAVVSGIFRLADDAPPLVVIGPLQSVGKVLPQQDVVARFQFKNLGSQTIEILGARDRCGEDGCFHTEGLPVQVAPHSTITVEVGYRKGDLGPFSVGHTFYTDCPARPEVTVTIQGQVVRGSPVAKSNVTSAESKL